MKAEFVRLVAGQGAGDINKTAERFAVHATDLGILWRDTRGRIAVAFGDTYGEGWGGQGAGPETADWRCNTLAHATTDLQIESMITDRPGHATQILARDPSAQKIADQPGHTTQTHHPTNQNSTQPITQTPTHHPTSQNPAHHPTNQDPSQRTTQTPAHHPTSQNPTQPTQTPVQEVTVIPTSGIAVGGRDYLHFMSVRAWGTGGRWTTNYAGLAHSDDGGQTWTKTTLWPNDPTGHSFQLGAFASKNSQVYLFGTPNGRLGDARLARVSLPDMIFRYWTGATWDPDPSAATPVLAGPVGELSVQYNNVTRQWVALHLDEHRAAIVLRTAPEPIGPWTSGQTVADGAEYPGLYGGFLHPDSANSPTLRFTMSRWDPYHVLLMSCPIIPRRS